MQYKNVTKIINYVQNFGDYFAIVDYNKSIRTRSPEITYI